jgi:hypothetical protein
VREDQHSPSSYTVEEHWVVEIAFALWQQQRLQPLAALALTAAESGTDEPDATRLPWLATLARYRARIERDLKLAQQSLEAARQSRPRPPSDPDLANPARLRWLADRIEARLHESPPANDTGEPEPATPFCTDEPTPAPTAACWTNRPEPQPQAERGVAPAAARTNEPERCRPLNRHERRRLLVLGRKADTAANRTSTNRLGDGQRDRTNLDAATTVVT